MNPDPADEFRPGTDRLMRFAVGAGALAFVGVWMATGAYRPGGPLAALYSPTATVLGVLLTLFFGAGAVYFLLQALPGACIVKLDATGVTVRSLFLERRFRWAEVRQFVLPVQADDRPSSRLVIRLEARDESLPDPRLFGCSASEMCQRLESARRQYQKAFCTVPSSPAI